ncbi:MAG: InlB B-repeat-containing protein [Coriobacteriia bacterium]|nr:InlB B-repeat-containing protein [Coriobacteriia bacterium]
METLMFSARFRFKPAVRIILILSVALFAGQASLSMAVPANPTPQVVRQADGSKLEVFQKGDEFFNWAEDSSGHVLGYDKNSKNWRYAAISNGKLVPGSVKARSSSNLATQSVPSSALTESNLKTLIKKAQSSRAAQEVGSTSSSSSGTVSTVKTAASVAPLSSSNLHPDLLVILVEFKDAPLTQSIDYWTNKYFSTTFGETSVNNYYKEASGAKDFSFSQISFVDGGQTISDLIISNPTSEISSLQLKDGVIKATFNVDHPGYTTDGYLTDAYVKKAFAAASSYIDYSSYPTTSDGSILRDNFHVSSIVAGWEASAQPSDKDQSTWGHANIKALSDGSVVSVDPSTGTLYSYATQGEIFSGSFLTSSAIPMGIGVTAHELGHDLGLPDLYDYGYDSQGVGAYSLMAAGSWGYAPGEYASETPVQLDAWSRVALGFVKPVTITSNQVNQYSLKSNSASDPTQYNVYKITSTANPNQYFLVENRQRGGYDAGLYGPTGRTSYTGILIYHIDENVLAVGGMHPNDDKYHQGVDIEEADGSNQLDNSDDYFSSYPYHSYTNHFFTKSGYSTFGTATSSNSNFHTPTVGTHTAIPETGDTDCHPETVPSGVLIKVNSESGSTMTFLNGATSIGFLVTFDANGGSVGSSSLTYTGTPVVLPTPTRTEYAFDGWYTAATGGTKVESPYTPSGAITLYAQWTKILYTLAYDSNGGAGTALPMQSGAASYTVAANTFALAGYTFVGWNTAADGAGTSYAAGATITPAANVTLYAKWTEGTVGSTFTAGGILYKVTALSPNTVQVGDGNNGEIVTGAIVIPPNVSDGTLTYDVTSLGESAFSDCTGLTSITIPVGVTSIGFAAFTDCTSLTSITIPEGVTSIEGSAFTYCSSLTSVIIPSSVTSIGTFAFESCTSLKSATFMGAAPTTFGTSVFASSASGFVISYYAGQTGWTNPWNGYTTVPITVTYNANGGAGTGTTYAAGATIAPSADVTLSAKWTINKYKVIFSGNGGSTPSALVCTSGKTLGTLPTSTRSGYAFQGWYNSSGTKVSSTTVVRGAVTLTARWKSKNAYVTSVAKSTGSWNKAWSKTSYYPSYRVLTISRYRSSVRITPAKSSNAMLYFKYKGESYARIYTYRTVYLKRGQSKTVYFRCISETGAVTHTYRLIVKRNK